MQNRIDNATSMYLKKLHLQSPRILKIIIHRCQVWFNINRNHHLVLAKFFVVAIPDDGIIVMLPILEIFITVWREIFSEEIDIGEDYVP